MIDFFGSLLLLKICRLFKITEKHWQWLLTEIVVKLRISQNPFFLQGKILDCCQVAQYDKNELVRNKGRIFFLKNQFKYAHFQLYFINITLKERIDKIHEIDQLKIYTEEKLRPKILQQLSTKNLEKNLL